MDGIEVQITEEKSLDRKGERETERVGLFSYGTEILGNNSKIARHQGENNGKRCNLCYMYLHWNELKIYILKKLNAEVGTQLC